MTPTAVTTTSALATPTPSASATPTPTAPTTSVPPSDPPDSPETECPGCRLISAPAPLVQPVCGPDNDVIRTQETSGVEWRTGTWRDGFLTVVAIAKPGTVFPQGVDNLWTFHDEGASCAAPAPAPAPRPQPVRRTPTRTPADVSRQQGQALEAGLVSVQRFRGPFRDTLGGLAALGGIAIVALWGLARQQERVLVDGAGARVTATGLMVPRTADLPGVALPVVARAAAPRTQLVVPEAPALVLAEEPAIVVPETPTLAVPAAPVVEVAPTVDTEVLPAVDAEPVVLLPETVAAWAPDLTGAEERPTDLRPLLLAVTAAAALGLGVVVVRRRSR